MSPIRIATEAEFRRLLSSVTEDVQAAYFHWQLYNDLRGSIRRYVRELNESPAFWRLTFAAHREVAVFRLARLYDQRGGISLVSMMGVIAENVHLFDEPRFRVRHKGNPFIENLTKDARRPDQATLEQDRRSVSSAERLVAKLLLVRDKVVAHRIHTYVLGPKPDPTAVLGAAHIRALLKRAANIINRYWRLFSAEVHHMRIIGHDDYRRVLEAVKRDRKAAQRRIAQQVKDAR